eukprot:82579-Chlamydomonas_euryale.AAC.2
MRRSVHPAFVIVAVRRYTAASAQHVAQRMGGCPGSMLRSAWAGAAAACGTAHRRVPRQRRAGGGQPGGGGAAGAAAVAAAAGGGAGGRPVVVAVRLDAAGAGTRCGASHCMLLCCGGSLVGSTQRH